jgi:hypothetical protein
LAPNGTLDASSYLGGSATDFLSIYRSDANGDVVLVGSSTSSNYRTTSRASDRSYNGEYDVVVSRVRFGRPTAAGSNSLGSLAFNGGSDTDKDDEDDRDDIDELISL